MERWIVPAAITSHIRTQIPVSTYIVNIYAEGLEDSGREPKRNPTYTWEDIEESGF